MPLLFIKYIVNIELVQVSLNTWYAFHVIKNYGLDDFIKRRIDHIRGRVHICKSWDICVCSNLEFFLGAQTSIDYFISFKVDIAKIASLLLLSVQATEVQWQGTIIRVRHT